jgi:predicted nucleic acid-binding Zn ribbon protein
MQLAGGEWHCSKCGHVISRAEKRYPSYLLIFLLAQVGVFLAFVASSAALGYANIFLLEVFFAFGLADIVLAVFAYNHYVWQRVFEPWRFMPNAYAGKLKLCPNEHENSPSAQKCWVCGAPMNAD